jgi:hypothetical protein
MWVDDTDAAVLQFASNVVNQWEDFTALDPFEPSVYLGDGLMMTGFGKDENRRSGTLFRQNASTCIRDHLLGCQFFRIYRCKAPKIGSLSTGLTAHHRELRRGVSRRYFVAGKACVTEHAQAQTLHAHELTLKPAQNPIAESNRRIHYSARTAVAFPGRGC